MKIDMKNKISASFVLLMVVSIGLGLSAEAVQPQSSQKKDGETPRDAAGWETAYLRNLRDIQRQEALQILQEQNTAPKSGSPAQKTTATTQEPLLLAQASSVPDGTPIYQWFSQNQAASPLGLVTSYPQDSSLSDQGFTYDQALSGIVMVQQGDTAGAQRIFDFYHSQWDGNGFWTVYNVNTVGGSKVEYDRVMGPNAWIGLFSLHYFDRTGDARALQLATDIGQWIRGLPHKDGGVAMGAAGTFWGNIYSVENNLDYYALARSLSTKATAKRDRQLFKNEISGLNAWFKNKAYDPATGLFKRSPSDTTPTAALDSNTWAVMVFGVAGLKSTFGVDADALITRAESRFAVQNDGTFGGSVTTAKGFDFSDAANAASIGRTGMKWVEGTNQMISVYTMLKTYYSARRTSDPAKAALYQGRADYFTIRNGENIATSTNGTSYFYTDRPGDQIWWDNPYWQASSGAAVGSSAWVYYSLLGINPFDI